MRFKVGDRVRFMKEAADYLCRGIPDDECPWSLKMVYTVKWVHENGDVTIQFGEGIPNTSGVIEVRAGGSWAMDWHAGALEKVPGEGEVN